MDILKKILVINGSRNKEGNTQFFISSILNELKKEYYKIEWLFPQDYTLLPIYETMNDDYTEETDDIATIKTKILSSDLLIISSPVYMHAMSSDIKLLLERLSNWAHTLRLNGKPVVVLSTCESNGFNNVIEPLSKIFSKMGGNIVAASNVSLVNELQDQEKFEEINKIVSERIYEYINRPPQSNKLIEITFQAMKEIIEYRIHSYQSFDYQNFDSEEKYWIDTGLIKEKTFEEFLRK